MLESYDSTIILPGIRVSDEGLEYLRYAFLKFFGSPVSRSFNFLSVLGQNFITFPIEGFKNELWWLL